MIRLEIDAASTSPGDDSLSVGVECPVLGAHDERAVDRSTRVTDSRLGQARDRLASPARPRGVGRGGRAAAVARRRDGPVERSRTSRTEVLDASHPQSENIAALAEARGAGARHSFDSVERADRCVEPLRDIVAGRRGGAAGTFHEVGFRGRSQAGVTTLARAPVRASSATRRFVSGAAGPDSSPSVISFGRRRVRPICVRPVGSD